MDISKLKTVFTHLNLIQVLAMSVTEKKLCIMKMYTIKLFDVTRATLVLLQRLERLCHRTDV